MKPMLACDWDASKIRFPLLAQPKIDGVRALNNGGELVGRSLKKHGNRFTTEFYSKALLHGFDGEMAAAHECDPLLCSKTASALARRDGQPFTLWWIFDDFSRPAFYEDRYATVVQRVKEITEDSYTAHLGAHLRVVPTMFCENMEQLETYDTLWLQAGYEGTIIRDPKGLYKQNRSTVREQGLLRIKRFIESEVIVLRLEEGQQNTNEAGINELGKTFRSTDAAGMVPNGQVGTIIGRDVVSGQEVRIGPGNMDRATRSLYWLRPELIVGKVVTYKYFPKGIKDLPRFPTFKSVRDSTDMSS